MYVLIYLFANRTLVERLVRNIDDAYSSSGYSVQNRRQKVFNRGDSCLCRGPWHSKSWQKLYSFTVLRISIWEGLELCLGGLSPPKPPVATGLILWTIF